MKVWKIMWSVVSFVIERILFCRCNFESERAGQDELCGVAEMMLLFMDAVNDEKQRGDNHWDPNIMLLQ